MPMGSIVPDSGDRHSQQFFSKLWHCTTYHLPTFWELPGALFASQLYVLSAMFLPWEAGQDSSSTVVPCHYSSQNMCATLLGQAGSGTANLP